MIARLSCILAEMRQQSFRHYAMEAEFFLDNTDMLNICQSYTELMDREALVEDLTLSEADLIDLKNTSSKKVASTDGAKLGDIASHFTIDALTNIVDSIQ